MSILTKFVAPQIFFYKGFNQKKSNPRENSSQNQRGQRSKKPSKSISNPLKTKIMIVDISELKINPFHSSIYQYDDIDDLVEDIKERGLLEKIVVNENRFIISGVRRFLALKELDYKEVDVVIKVVKEIDEKLTTISYNKQRSKTCGEKLEEARRYKELWGKRRGRKSGNKKSTNAIPVDTRKKICKKLSMSAGNLSKLEFIYKINKDVIGEIDKGKISIEQAYRTLKKNQEVKNIRNIEKVLPTTISNSTYTIFNESSHDLSKLKDKSIQTIVTSPPYWQIRSYTEVANELGSEKISEEFVQKMVNHLHACHRVLKDEGSFFLNLGDKFVNKNLQNIPHRIVIELQKKGWILRNTIIWKKINKLPGTSTDNLTCSYEFIFHLVKSKDYYFNPVLLPIQSAPKQGVNIIKLKDAKFKESNFGHVTISGLSEGKKLEDFWTEDIVMTAGVNQRVNQKYGISDHPAPYPIDICILPILQTSRPGDVVLDIFSGSGTTGEAALLLGRKYVGYEFNPNFNEGQKRRLDNAIKTYNESQAIPFLPNDLLEVA